MKNHKKHIQVAQTESKSFEDTKGSAADKVVFDKIIQKASQTVQKEKKTGA